jgi:hypothetical protein
MKNTHKLAKRFQIKVTNELSHNIEKGEEDESKSEESDRDMKIG